MIRLILIAMLTFCAGLVLIPYGETFKERVKAVSGIFAAGMAGVIIGEIIIKLL